ncbi:MAG: MBL fold metallo-hydrolase [Oscillospiraceae bacterium]
MPNSPLKNLNAYFIKADGKGGRNLLIDTGFRREECRASLLGGLAELGVSMDDSDIFLTHLHADHSGLAADVAGVGTRIFMSRDDSARLAGFKQADDGDGLKSSQILQGFPDTPRFRGFLNRGRRFSCESPERFEPVDDGDVFTYGGHRLQAVSTPGHTPGHLCLYDAENKIMFLGDHVLFDITPNITAWQGFSDPLGTYIQNLRKIREYDVRLPLPGHRGVPCDMKTRIDQIIEHHGARLKEILDTLDLHPGITAYELSSRMSWNIRADGGWENYPVPQIWFAVGETGAHLEYLLPRGMITRERRDGVDLYFPA